MASWIVHLRVAEVLLNQFAWLDPAFFAIGNIAPDSGIPDEKWEKFDPPTTVTHFSPTGKDCDTQGFYRRYLETENKLPANPLRRSFLWGYFCHLVTDNLWSQKVGIPTKERWKADFESNPDFIWKVKGDWYGLDFIYVRDHPETLFWQVFLNCRYEASYLEFLPARAVQMRIDYIKEYYQRNDEEIQALYSRPYIYLSQEQYDDFVEQAAREICAIWGK
jgi:hypothetical protein